MCIIIPVLQIVKMRHKDETSRPEGPPGNPTILLLIALDGVGSLLS